MNGILNLDKAAGISSARAVDRVKRLLPRGTKIGHAGTLDPFATGVLLLLIGKATKQCERLMDQPKQYEATIKFGFTTATDDLESEEQPYSSRHRRDAHATKEAIRDLLPKFVGAIQQRPPAFSAMKLGGRRAYDLARRGEVVQLEARTVNVYAIEMLDYAWPLLRIGVDCGRGTYIRALARDIGEALDVGGYLTQLRRTRVGSFHIAQATTLEQLQAEGVARHLQAIAAITDAERPSSP